MSLHTPLRLLTSVGAFFASGACFSWGRSLLLNARVENGSPEGNSLIGSLGFVCRLLSVQSSDDGTSPPETALSASMRHLDRRIRYSRAA